MLSLLSVRACGGKQAFTNIVNCILLDGFTHIINCILLTTCNLLLTLQIASFIILLVQHFLKIYSILYFLPFTSVFPRLIYHQHAFMYIHDREFPMEYTIFSNKPTSQLSVSD